jgi:DNA-binding response OmpR family regulator
MCCIPPLKDETMFRVLVIDDEKDILLMLKKMLERAGFEVDIALNGVAGMELFERLAFDLVITDIIMPDKEGLELIREIKKKNPSVRIIAMSGGGRLSAQGYLDVAKKFGADKIFQKPFTQKELLHSINELFTTLT